MSDFWVITTYFNPCGYSPRKLENFQRFAEGVRSQDAKLLSVECAFLPNRGHWEIFRDLVDKAVRVHSGSVLWQKERLLNIGLEELPADCSNFAWLDADLLFDNPDWVRDALEALKQHRIVQLFEDSWDGKEHRHSMPVAQRANPDNHVIAGHPGYAWAARREGFPGFYDRSVVGGGDTILAWAIYGHAGLWPGYGRAENYFSKAQLADITKWTAEFHAWAQADIGYIPGIIRHLPHGDREHRQHLTRLMILKENDFDPATDLRFHPGQGPGKLTDTWEWNSKKPDMHRRVERYFQQRNWSNIDVGKKVRVLQDGEWIDGTVVAKSDDLFDVETARGMAHNVSDRHGNLEEVYG